MVTFTLSQRIWEFAKSHAICAMRANMPNACKLLILMCQCAKKHVKVPQLCQFFNLVCQCVESVPIFKLDMVTCQTTCQFFILASQNIPKGIWIFQTFLLQNVERNFNTLLLYKNFYIILDIGGIAQWLATCTWKPKALSSSLLLAICRGEVSAVMTQLIPKCEAGGSSSEEIRKCPPSSPAVLCFVNVHERKPR